MFPVKEKEVEKETVQIRLVVRVGEEGHMLSKHQNQAFVSQCRKIVSWDIKG